VGVDLIEFQFWGSDPKVRALCANTVVQVVELSELVATRYYSTPYVS